MKKIAKVLVLLVIVILMGAILGYIIGYDDYVLLVVSTIIGFLFGSLSRGWD